MKIFGIFEGWEPTGGGGRHSLGAGTTPAIPPDACPWGQNWVPVGVRLTTRKIWGKDQEIGGGGFHFHHSVGDDPDREEEASTVGGAGGGLRPSMGASTKVKVMLIEGPLRIISKHW